MKMWQQYRYLVSMPTVRSSPWQGTTHCRARIANVAIDKIRGNKSAMTVSDGNRFIPATLKINYQDFGCQNTQSRLWLTEKILKDVD